MEPLKHPYLICLTPPHLSFLATCTHQKPHFWVSSEHAAAHRITHPHRADPPRRRCQTGTSHRAGPTPVDCMACGDGSVERGPHHGPRCFNKQSRNTAPRGFPGIKAPTQTPNNSAACVCTLTYGQSKDPRRSSGFASGFPHLLVRRWGWGSGAANAAAAGKRSKKNFCWKVSMALAARSHGRCRREKGHGRLVGEVMIEY